MPRALFIAPALSLAALVSLAELATADQITVPAGSVITLGGGAVIETPSVVAEPPPPPPPPEEPPPVVVVTDPPPPAEPPPIEPPLPTQSGIGMGCTTANYIDKDCDGFGVGKKAGGSYLIGDLGNNPDGSGITDSPGDMPDADDMDPAVNTTASWQAKWGNDNAGMVNFLRDRKGFTNTDRVFYVSLDGSDATGAMNDPARPFRTVTPAYTELSDRQGGAVIFRGGNWGIENIWQFGQSAPSGSPGHALLLMSYPGELVVSNSQLVAGNAQRVAGNVTVDGFVIRQMKLNRGDNVSLTEADHYTFVNNEFIGGHQLSFGNHSEDIRIEQNVFHHMATHAIYFLWSSAACPICDGPIADPVTGDVDFAAQELQYRADPTTGSNVSSFPSYRGSILNNVIYNSGTSGYEPIHLNNSHLAATVDGNIIGYGGGTGIGIYHGHYHARITNNVIFDSGRDGITYFLGQYAKTHRLNTIANNTIYVGNPKDAIRGTNPAGGILTAELIPPAATYAGPHWIKDSTFTNNLIVTYNRGIPAGFPPMRFARNSFPDTHIIQNNLFWSNDGTPAASDAAMWITADAGGSVSGINPTAAQLVALSPQFSGNIYSDPKFVDASATYTATPEKFNLAIQAGSPAIDAGTVTGAPKIDVRGALRDASPDIGAYEFLPNGGVIPLASLTASSRLIVERDSVTLTWNSLNADSCTGDGFNTGGAKSGSVVVTPDADTTYSVTCRGAVNSAATQDVLVRRLPALDSPTLLTFTGPTKPIAPGGVATLSFTATGAVHYRCFGIRTGIGTGVFMTSIGPTAGSANVRPLVTTTYAMGCYNIYGATSPLKFVTVTVK